MCRRSINHQGDPELVAVVRRALIAEGVALHEYTPINKVEAKDGHILITLVVGEGKSAETKVIRGSHVLVATGRRPNVQGLNLEAAGIAYDNHGIPVNLRGRTSNKNIYAIGDVTGPYQFTHMAAYQAKVVLQNILFKLPVKIDFSAVPWVTLTDPELAHVGMSEMKAKATMNGKFEVIKIPFTQNDRAQAQGTTEGLLKAIIHKNGYVLGCSIVGPQAGELIMPWAMAITHKMKAKDLTSVIVPYPTLSELSQRATGAFYAPKLFSDRMKKIVTFLMRLKG